MLIGTNPICRIIGKRKEIAVPNIPASSSLKYQFSLRWIDNIESVGFEPTPVANMRVILVY